MNRQFGTNLDLHIPRPPEKPSNQASPLCNRATISHLSPKHRRQPSLVMQNTPLKELNLTPIKRLDDGQQDENSDNILEMDLIEVEDVQENSKFKRVLRGKLTNQQKQASNASTVAPNSGQSGRLSTFSQENEDPNIQRTSKLLFTEKSNSSLLQSSSHGIKMLCRNCGLVLESRVELQEQRQDSVLQKICFCASGEVFNAPIYVHYCSNCNAVLGKIQAFM